MNIVIPYKDFHGPELKYCLRGIEKYIHDPEITIIGDRPEGLKYFNYIPFKDRRELTWKEQNIFFKLLLVDFDFLFFNDDHFLLEPFSHKTYHYTNLLSQSPQQNSFRITIQNTIDLFGDLPSYYRHGPIFIERKILDKIEKLNWNKPWGYCTKSIYCHLKGVKGVNYDDLKIRSSKPESEIKKLISGRPYFSTGNYAMDRTMMKVLENLYPQKSIYENSISYSRLQQV